MAGVQKQQINFENTTLLKKNLVQITHMGYSANTVS